MSKSRVAKSLPLDPTLPKVHVTIDGKKYYLVFTFQALVLAEAKLREQGVEINMLQALDLSSLDATKFVPLLWAGLSTHCPDITFEQAATLVTMKNYPTLYQGIGEAFLASLAEPDKDAKEVPLAQAE